jgi:hypothetical protein
MVSPVLYCSKYIKVINIFQLIFATNYFINELNCAISLK